jgi:hypothetical protein
LGSHSIASLRDRELTRRMNGVKRKKTLTELQAELLGYAVANLRARFDEIELAVGLGWSLEQTRKILRECEDLGLLHGPDPRVADAAIEGSGALLPPKVFLKALVGSDLDSLNPWQATQEPSCHHGALGMDDVWILDQGLAELVESGVLESRSGTDGCLEVRLTRPYQVILLHLMLNPPEGW